MKSATIALALLSAVAGLGACSTDDNGPRTQCDMLARSPLEPGSNGRGVRAKDVDVASALAACTAQAQLTPNHAPTYIRLSRVYSLRFDQTHDQDDLENFRNASLRADQLGHPLGAFQAYQGYLMSASGLPEDAARAEALKNKAYSILGEISKRNVPEANFVFALLNMYESDGSLRSKTGLKNHNVLTLFEKATANNPELNWHLVNHAFRLDRDGACGDSNLTSDDDVDDQTACAAIFHIAGHNGSADASFIALDMELRLADRVFRASSQGNLDAEGARMVDDIKAHLTTYRATYPDEPTGLRIAQSLQLWDAQVAEQRERKARNEAFMGAVFNLFTSGGGSSSSRDTTYEDSVRRTQDHIDRMLECQALGDAAVFGGDEEAMTYAWSGC